MHEILKLFTAYVRCVCDFTIHHFRVDCKKNSEKEVDGIGPHRKCCKKVRYEGGPARRKVDNESEREQLCCFVADETAIAAGHLTLREEQTFKQRIERKRPQIISLKRYSRIFEAMTTESI